MIGSTNSIIAHTDWYATIEVTTNSGTTVTCNGETKTADTGYVTFTVYKQGEYTITGTLEGHTNSTSVYVYSATSYSTTLYMSATIRVNAPVNTVVTISGTSKTVTGTYVDFTVYSTGSYTVTGVLDGITTTNTVYVSSMGNTYSTTLVFGCYVNIYSNAGADVVYNGLRQTVGDSGYVRYRITGTGTYRFLCIYKGQSKDKSLVVTSIASDINEDIYFIPSTYQEVEYLQSSGTQYIDTGLNNTTGVSQFNIKVKFEVQSSGSAMAGIWGSVNRGAATLINDLGFNAVQASNGRPNLFTCCYTTSTTQLNSQLLYHNTAYDLECEYKNNISRVTCNNQTQTYNNTTATKYFTNNIYLFASNDTAIGGKLNGKIYSCSIELNNVLVRHFVPCYRKSDSVLGMYDIVTDTFYTNDGTGSFTAGHEINPVLPDEYQELEYLKSDGYSWIDTGVLCDVTKNWKIEANAMIFNNDRVVIAGSYGDAVTSSLGLEFGGTSNGYPRQLRGWFASYYSGTIHTISQTYVTHQVTLNTCNYHTYEWNATQKLLSISLTENGTTYTASDSFSYQAVQTGTYNILLFSDNRSDKSSIRTPISIYNCKLYVADTLVRHFIPCKRISDGELGMYDLVNGVFYENAGTGEFTAGNPVANASLPSEYTYVKYIASTSDKTQYLNLGETGTNTSGMLIKVYDELEDATKDCVYVGGRAVQNGRCWIGGYDRSYLSQGYAYFGWNTLNRLDGIDYATPISATKTLRTFYMNYLNNRQEGYDNTKAFDISETLVQNTPLYAFAASNNGSLALNSWMRLYYTVLTSGSSISNIFIPCKRNSDNVLGMYDIVKGNFKTNAGTGTFTVGADVN